MSINFSNDEIKKFNAEIVGIKSGAIAHTRKYMKDTHNCDDMNCFNNFYLFVTDNASSVDEAFQMLEGTSTNPS